MLRHHPKSPPFRTNCWLRPVRNSNGLRMREFLPSPFRHWNLCSFRWGAPAQSSAAPCKDPSQPQTHPKSLWLMKRFIGPSPRAKKKRWMEQTETRFALGWLELFAYMGLLHQVLKVRPSGAKALLLFCFAPLLARVSELLLQ